MSGEGKVHINLENVVLFIQARQSGILQIYLKKFGGFGNMSYICSD